MSHLGDLIVEVGPFAEGEELGGFGHALTSIADLNALRDELIELRELRTNALAMAEEYNRTPRPVASMAVASMLMDWCYGTAERPFSEGS